MAAQPHPPSPERAQARDNASTFERSPEPKAFLTPPIDIETAADDVLASATLVDQAEGILFDTPLAWADAGMPRKEGFELWLLPTEHRFALRRAILLLRSDVAALVCMAEAEPKRHG